MVKALMGLNHKNQNYIKPPRATRTTKFLMLIFSEGWFQELGTLHICMCWQPFGDLKTIQL
jgi:hypothetical protein